MTRTAAEIAEWQGYLTLAELAAIKQLAVMLPPNPLAVSIGAGAGTATLGILEERPDALIFSVDILANEAETTTNEHLRLAEAGFAATGHVIRVWGDSKVVGKKWRFPVDFLIVDGDPTAAGLQGDIDVWLRHVRPGGLAAFHDYTRKHWPDVRAVIDTAFANQPRLLWVDTLIAFRVGETHPRDPLCCGRCDSGAVPSC